MSTFFWIYKSPRFEDMYIYLSKEDDFERIPEVLTPKLGKLEFVLSFDLETKKQLAREDIEQVKTNLLNEGFHLQLPENFSPQMFYGE